MLIVDRVATLDALDIAHIAGLDRDGVNATLVSLARVRAWIDATQVVLIRRLQHIASCVPSMSTEADIAGATLCSRASAAGAVRRAEVLGSLPVLSEALTAGEISVAHVDVVKRVWLHLTIEQRTHLAARDSWLTAVATRSTPEQFTRVLRHELHRLDIRAGESRLQQQQRNAYVRFWLNPDTGMWCVHGEFDPETGSILQGRFENTIDTMFHSALPQNCPTGSNKQDFLRALAFIQLTEQRPGSSSSSSSSSNSGSSAGRTIDDYDRRYEMQIVIDLETLRRGLHEHSIITNNTGAELPVESYRRIACQAAIIPTVLDTDGVVLDQGRETRLANRAQRRALRAMYTTCAIPDCVVASKYCEPHHVMWWQHGGTSNLDNLLPLCSRHHNNVHEGGWQLELHPNRALTIAYPSGVVQTTGPPSQQRVA